MKEWENSKDWDNNWELFLNTLKRPFSVLAIVDCEFRDPVCNSVEKTVTRQYYRQKMISSDVFNNLQEFQEAGDKELLRVSAIGRFFPIGTLYNSISHQFTGKSLLKPGTDLTKMNLTREDYNNETLDIFSSGFEEKFTVMDVQPPALQYSILLNPKSLQNSGKVFQEFRGFDPKWASKTLYHVYNTEQNAILDADEESFDFISISRLTKGGATHFVQKIVYGGQTTISLSTPVSSKDRFESSFQTIVKDLENIQDILGEKSNGNDLNSNTNPNKSPSSEIILSRNKYQIKFASDIFQNSRGEFRSEKDLTDFLEKYPALKQRVNKGHPVLYVLYPLKNLQKYFGVVPGIPEDPSELVSTQTSLEFARIFESFYDAKGKINELKLIFKQNKDFVPDPVLEDFKSLDNKFQRFDYNFTKYLRGLVSEKSDEKLKAFLQEFKQDESTLQFFNVSGPTLKFQALEHFSAIQKKIQFFNDFFQEFPQIQFIGRGKTLVKELSDFPADQLVFVLFHKLEFAVKDDQNWMENLHIFRHSLSGKPYNKLVILDCDFNDDPCQNLTLQKSVIHLYRDQHLISPDVLANWTTTAQKQTPVVERKSLGRPLKLGQLYNIRNEMFLDKSILQRDSKPNSEIRTRKTNPLKISTKIIPSPNLEKRLEILNVEAELELAFIFQNQNSRKLYDGSGKFLDEKLSFTSAVALSVELDSISLNLSSPFLPKYFNPLSLFPLGGVREAQGDGPTHFVQEIRLGSNTIFSLGDSAVEDDVTYLEKNLGKDENDLWGQLRQQDVSSSSSSVRNQSKTTDLELLEDFTVFTDVTLDNGLRVIKGGNFKDRTQKISKKAISQESDDSSISFVLWPLESLQQPLGVLIPAYNYQPLSTIFQAKSRDIIHLFYGLFLDLNETETLKVEMETTFKYGFSDSSLTEIQGNLKHLRDFFIRFKTEFQFHLESFKTGAEDETKLNGTFYEFSEKFHHSEIDEGLKHHREKIKFLRNISKNKNVEYLGRGKSFNDFNLKLNGKPKYLLYFRDIHHLADLPEWTKTTENFFNYLAIEKNECFIVDCDFPFPHCDEQKGGNQTEDALVFVHQYVDGVLNSSDYMSQMNLERNQTEEERAKDKILLYNLKEQVESLKKSLTEEEQALETVRNSLGMAADKIEKQVEDHDELKNQTLESFEQEKARIFSLKDDIKNLSSTFEREQKSLRKENEALSTSFVSLKKNAVPVGFVYVQLPRQPAPAQLWPNFTWDSISVDYAGLFFRAEGGGSSPFGQTQNDRTNRISQIAVSENGCSEDNYKLPSSFSVPESGWSQVGRAGWYVSGAGRDKYNCEGIKVESSGGETRPRNTAVCIWKRTA